MTIKDRGVKPLVSELAIIEFENRRLLDDDSIRLVAEVRSRNLLSDDAKELPHRTPQKALRAAQDAAQCGWSYAGGGGAAKIAPHEVARRTAFHEGNDPECETAVRDERP